MEKAVLETKRLMLRKMCREDQDSLNKMLQDPEAVSYTHLDVYKRQVFSCAVAASAKEQILPCASERPRVIAVYAQVHPFRLQGIFKPQHIACLLYTSRCV